MTILLTLLIDDNYNNCNMAEQLGWNSVHLVEDGTPIPAEQASKYQIEHLDELRRTFPKLFKAGTSMNDVGCNGVQ